MNTSDLNSTVPDVLRYYLGVDSPYRGIILAVAVLLFLIALRGAIGNRFKKTISRNVHKAEKAEHFLRIYNAVWKFIIAVFVIIAATGSFALLGLTAGFFGTMLGWSLQAPIRGLAAWLMVAVTRPFQIGDRINVAGVTGDVTGLQLNHIVLNQVGGTVQGEERSGRGVFVPTAMLFEQNIINYNLFGKEKEGDSFPASKTILDEVPVRVSMGSDYELAKKLCIEAAKKAVEELLDYTGEEPYTRTEFVPSCIRILVRYKTIPAKRQEVSTRVTELIWKAFRENRDKVRYRYPMNVTSVVRTSHESLPPAATDDKRPIGKDGAEM